MDRNEVIALAKEADLIETDDTAQDIIEFGLELWLFGERSMKAIEKFAALIEARAAEREREACIDIIETFRIPVGNSAAGELACEWTWDALKRIRDDIRERKENT